MFFKRKQKESSTSNEGFEEGVERKTPKLGYLLLIFMFAAGIWFGWFALDDIERIPALPKSSISKCARDYEPEGNNSLQVSGYEYFDRSDSDYSEDCNFHPSEAAAGIPDLFQERLPFKQKLGDLLRQSSKLVNDEYETKNRLSALQQTYGISVAEEGADLDHKLYSVSEIQKQIYNFREKQKSLTQQKMAIQVKIDEATAQLKPVDEKIKTAYVPLFHHQNWLLGIYKFKIFLLQILFIGPLFYFSLRRYLKLLAKNSPYTIIFTTVVGIMGVLLLKIIFQWIHGAFLARLLEILFRFFHESEIIRSLVFYGGMLLSLLTFGGAVYWIQKRIFNSGRIAIRRFRAKKCPACEASLDLAEIHCPNCGTQVRTKCSNCGERRFIGLPFCPTCRNKVVEGSAG